MWSSCPKQRGFLKRSWVGRGTSRSSLHGIGVAVCATGLAAASAHAQLAGGGLSDTSYSPGGTSLRDTVSSLLAGPSTTAVRPWTFSGDVDVEVGATDSPGGIGSGWQPVILIAPDLLLNGVTSRVNVALAYSPRLAYYPSTSDQTILSQSFNGSATAAIVSDLLYLNLRGLSEVSSRFGNTSLLSNSFVSRSEAVQTSSFSVSPYIQKTIGTYGTVTAGYTYAQTFQDGDNRYSPYYYAPSAAQSAGFGTTGNLQSNTEYGSFTTGEVLGRVQDAVSVSVSQLSGSSYYQGATTLSANNRISYLVYRWLTIFGNVGYEEYNYPSSRYRLNQPTWSVGATFIPNPDSSLTVQYGQVAGINTVLANGTYATTPRTRVFGSYVVDIQTGLGARQALLGGTSVGPGGVLLSNLTGGPTLANSYLASQYPLSRVKTATLGGSLLLDRDVFTISFSHSTYEQLGQSTDVLGISTSSGTSTSNTIATANWQHDLSPVTSLNSGVSYGVSNNGIYYGVPGQSQDTLQLYTSLIHRFTDTLSGSLSYSHSERFGGATQNLPAAFGGSASQNLALVGLRKSF